MYAVIIMRVVLCVHERVRDEPEPGCKVYIYIDMRGGRVKRVSERL